GFVQRELDWLVATHEDLHVLERSNERESLELVRFYLRQQQRTQASQLLTARSILLQVERGLDPSLLRASFHALLHPGEGDVAVAGSALSQWAGGGFSQAFQMVVGLGAAYEATLSAGHRARDVEELCMDYLSRDD